MLFYTLEKIVKVELFKNDTFVVAKNLIKLIEKFLKKKYSWKLFTVKQKVNIIIKNSVCIEDTVSLKKGRKKRK